MFAVFNQRFGTLIRISSSLSQVGMEGLNLVASDVSGAIAFPSTSTLIQHLEFIMLHLIDAFTRHIFKITGIMNPILALLV